MTDPSPDRAKPIPLGDVEAHYHEVKSFAHRRWRASRRNNWFLVGLAVVLLASNLAQSSALRALFPLVRFQTLFFGVMEDGTVNTALTFRDLSETEREAVLKETAWKYVKFCEGYSYAVAQYNYDACRHMSDEPVKQVFEAKWFLPDGKDAPDSPQKLLGRNGQIDVERLERPYFVRDHVIQVHYKRKVWHYDDQPQPSWVCKAPACTTATATIDYTLLDRMPTGTEDDNSLKFFVTRYQVSEGAGR